MGSDFASLMLMGKDREIRITFHKLCILQNKPTRIIFLVIYAVYANYVIRFFFFNILGYFFISENLSTKNIKDGGAS